VSWLWVGVAGEPRDGSAAALFCFGGDVAGALLDDGAGAGAAAVCFLGAMIAWAGGAAAVFAAEGASAGLAGPDDAAAFVELGADQ
jgi:hypothetical protein